MVRNVCIALLIALTLGGPCFAGGSPLEDIPFDSWIYDAVFTLTTRGHFPDLLAHTRPYDRGDIVNYLRDIQSEGRQFPVGDQILLDRLFREFSEELVDGSTDEFVRLGIGPTARIDQERHGLARNRAGFDALASFGSGDWLAARARVRFDTDGRFDTQFHGEYWKEKFTAWVEQAVIKVERGRFTGSFGREYWRWGRSPTDAMLISDQSPPFDGARMQYRAQRWSFTMVATMLDSMQFGEPVAAKRYLIGHRLNWKPRHNLECAISEIIVFGGVTRPWALNYLNPILPYYWEQLNNNTNDNPLWNLELSWRPMKRTEFYGELMIDDFQIDFSSEPQQIGVLLGTAWSPDAQSRLLLNAEYQRVNTFVYGQGQPWNRYFHHRRPNGSVIGIGSNLGTDADRILFQPTWHQSEFIDVTGQFEYVRHGADRIDSTQASGVPKNVPFPSGTVERRLTIVVGPHVQFGGNVVLDVLGGFERVTNVDNVDGQDREGFLFRLRFSALVWRTFGV